MGLADIIKANNGVNALIDELVLLTGDEPRKVLFIALTRYKRQVEEEQKLNEEIRNGVIGISPNEE